MKEGRKSNYGYVVLLGLLLLNFIQGCWANTVSIYYVPLSEGLGVSITMISLYSTIQCMAAAAFMSFVAKATTRYDTRITITTAVILVTVGMLINASLKNVYMLWSSGVVTASACCLITFMLNPIVLGNWFCKRQATYLGLCMFAQGLGGTIYASVGSSLIQNFGWRSSYLCLAAIVALIGLPVALFMVRKDPEQMGLLPVGYGEQGEKSDSETVSEPARGMDAGKVKRTSVFFILVVALSMWSFANCFNFFVNSYAYSIGHTAMTAGVIASSLLLGQTVGSVGNGFTCDKSIKGTVIFGCCFVIGGYILMLMAGTSTMLLTIAAFVVGYMYSGFAVVGPMILQDIFGTKDFASIYGIVSTVGMFISAFSFTIWSEISGRVGYQASMVTCIVLYAGVLVAFICAMAMGKKIKASWERS